jgi:DNA-directed RNA polymerase specialized sigma24 family protein
MDKTSVMRDAPAGDYLSAAEVGAAFDALSPDDKLKLGAIETIRRSGTGFGIGELLHEVVCRALTGDRNCPRDVPFMAFLVETMRSIASHARKKQRRSAPLSAVPHASSAEDGQGDPPATGPSPEEALIEQQDAAAVQAIHGRFEDDPEAQLVLMGWGDGLRGRALREATGLDQSALDYTAKRIRSRMRALYPEGWGT